jgi:hypothetical protein
MKPWIIFAAVATWVAAYALGAALDWNNRRKKRPYKPRIYVHRGPMDAAKDRGLELFRKLTDDGRSR